MLLALLTAVAALANAHAPLTAPDPSASTPSTSPAAPNVSCYLRGGTTPTSCCRSGRTCLPFATYVLDRSGPAWTRHRQLNCYPPHTGSQWGTGDLAAEKHTTFTVATCEAACAADRRCDAITVGPPGGVPRPPPPPPPPPPAAAFEWIRAIERGPPGRKYVLNASVYLIDRQYQVGHGLQLQSLWIIPTAAAS